jgi:hypothetical protein
MIVPGKLRPPQNIQFALGCQFDYNGISGYHGPRFNKATAGYGAAP